MSESLIVGEVVRLQDEITDVRMGPIEDGVETFTFQLRGEPYKAFQSGRLRDFCIGHSKSADSRIAVMAIADGLVQQNGESNVKLASVGEGCSSRNLKVLEVSSRYVVMDEHTLGYLDETSPWLMGVLAGSVLKGGYNPLNGPVSIVPGHTRLRQATEADFAAYRVVVPPDFKGEQASKPKGA